MEAAPEASNETVETEEEQSRPAQRRQIAALDPSREEPPSPEPPTPELAPARSTGEISQSELPSPPLSSAERGVSTIAGAISQRRDESQTEPGAEALKESQPAAPTISLAAVEAAAPATESAAREELPPSLMRIQVVSALPPGVAGASRGRRVVRDSNGARRSLVNGGRTGSANREQSWIRQISIAIVLVGGEVLSRAPEPGDPSATRLRCRMTPEQFTAFTERLAALGLGRRDSTASSRIPASQAGAVSSTSEGRSAALADSGDTARARAGFYSFQTASPSARGRIPSRPIGAEASNVIEIVVSF